MRLSNILKALLCYVGTWWSVLVFWIPKEYHSHPAIMICFVLLISMMVLGFIASLVVPYSKQDDCFLTSDGYINLTAILCFILCTYLNLNFPHKDCFLTRLFFLN